MTTYILNDFIGWKILIERRKQQTTPRDQVRLPSKCTVDGLQEKMALQTDIGKRIPEGVIRLTKDEALYHQKTVIKEWPSKLEVGFIRYGCLVAGFSNLTSSGIIVNYFRNYLRTGTKTSLLTFVPGIIVPGYLGYFLTDRILTENILLMKMDCPICHQMKFALSQFYIGVGFPALYSYVSYAGMAMVTKSYPLPDINTEARKFWKVTFDIFKEGARKFQVAGLIQTLVVLFLPYLQNKQLLTVMSKLHEKEKEMRPNS